MVMTVVGSLTADGVGLCKRGWRRGCRWWVVNGCRMVMVLGLGEIFHLRPGGGWGEGGRVGRGWWWEVRQPNWYSSCEPSQYVSSCNSLVWVVGGDGGGK